MGPANTDIGGSILPRFLVSSVSALLLSSVMSRKRPATDKTVLDELLPVAVPRDRADLCELVGALGASDLAHRVVLLQGLRQIFYAGYLRRAGKFDGSTPSSECEAFLRRCLEYAEDSSIS